MSGCYNSCHVAFPCRSSLALRRRPNRKIVRSIKRPFPTQDKFSADSANLHVNAPEPLAILVISTCISRVFDICNRTRLGFGQRLLAMILAMLLPEAAVLLSAGLPVWIRIASNLRRGVGSWRHIAERF
ncbi:protein of unknown function [Pseudomonas sp. JV551A1]|uniref:Uncharacterized protein n=1 Tax=Pseudomonas inefficax TaxID=2078786 RepID=A0AAQ1SRK3_9PSED|nr:protein of unknown function [Pseudomonas sp. JV551A1]SPO58716.1 protein of unknown function [Pseudomonas inefficax]